jgi:hypothetical protein
MSGVAEESRVPTLLIYPCVILSIPRIKQCRGGF